MKALTLTQPWASLVAIGAKQVETRSWNTQYRGTLAIHAAKGFPPDARRLTMLSPFQRGLKSMLEAPDGSCYGWRALPRGQIIALTELKGIVPTEQVVFDPNVSEAMFYLDENRLHLPPSEEPFGDYSPGRFAWILGRTTPYPQPFDAKGSLGLWNWEIGS